MNDFDDLEPTRSLFWLAVKWATFAFALIVVIRLFVMPLLVADKLVGREIKKFDAETSAQVYDNSRQFQQGTNRDIARYCREFRSTEGAAKEAVADLIASTLDTYQGPLTPENEKCKMEIGL